MKKNSAMSVWAIKCASKDNTNETTKNSLDNYLKEVEKELNKKGLSHCIYTLEQNELQKSAAIEIGIICYDTEKDSWLAATKKNEEIRNLTQNHLYELSKTCKFILSDNEIVICQRKFTFSEGIISKEELEKAIKKYNEKKETKKEIEDFLILYNKIYS